MYIASLFGVNEHDTAVLILEEVIPYGKAMFMPDKVEYKSYNVTYEAKINHPAQIVIDKFGDVFPEVDGSDDEESKLDAMSVACVMEGFDEDDD